MATSISMLSRRLYRSLLSNPRVSQMSMPFCTSSISSQEGCDSEASSLDSDRDTVPDSQSPSSSPSQSSGEQRAVYDAPLESGLDMGIYKAIVMGEVGQSPVQKKLKSGRTVTLFSVGTGGIRNNRRPLDNEDPREYANRCAVQWHRVSIYVELLGNLVIKQAQPGVGKETRSPKVLLDWNMHQQ
ncbi:uncharacterized protein LOC110820318 isoform X2 [Carica papaya]|uniref:uncharacterized protein LOC110820318 isoform X2 n=1 Tax=Carica papaya TaxID=3649 RepID=UPI000B8CFA4A|nr:uncharacterized protein LOC110820318 isoform X2 [Carica papaya]